MRVDHVKSSAEKRSQVQHLTDTVQGQEGLAFSKFDHRNIPSLQNLKQRTFRAKAADCYAVSVSLHAKCYISHLGFRAANVQTVYQMEHAQAAAWVGLSGLRVGHCRIRLLLR